MLDPQRSSLGQWIAHIHRLIAATFGDFLRGWCQKHAKDYTLTPPQWGLLTHLNLADGLPIGVIGQRLAVDAPTVTDVVGRMERNGLVTRVHDNVDRRVVHVYLTEEGRMVLASLAGEVDSFFARLTSAIAPEDLQALKRVMVILHDTLGTVASERAEP